jgi:hypothetical protein
MDLLMSDAVRQGAACDAQDAIDEDSADERPADDSGDSGVARIWASRQTPEGRTPATGPLRQTSSWPECSTIPAGAKVPEVTAPKEIPYERHPGPTPGGLCLRKSDPYRADTSPTGSILPCVLDALCGVVMVVVMMVVMASGGKGRTGEYENQKDSSDDLLHGLNLA